MASERKYGDLPVPGVPDDEPVFVLRAQDLAALDTLRAYWAACSALGAGAGHLQGVQDTMDDFKGWQGLPSTRTKVPD